MPKVTETTSINDLQFQSLMAHDIRYDPDDSLPLYIGINQLTEGDENAVGWIIFKFTYSGNNVTRIQKAHGTWSGRVALFT